MLHRLREAMTDAGEMLGGDGTVVELDETFVGGKVINMHKGARIKSNAKGGNKAIVFGMLERGGKVKARVIADRKRQQIKPAMAEAIAPGANIITDEFSTYQFTSDAYSREVITHAMEYVNGHIHTNGIENFWSLLRRGLKGTYISVEPFHLDVHVKEQVFRYNNRKEADDFARFATCMMGIQGKRLTYQALTQRPGAVKEPTGAWGAAEVLGCFTCARVGLAGTILFIKSVNLLKSLLMLRVDSSAGLFAGSIHCFIANLRPVFGLMFEIGTRFPLKPKLCGLARPILFPYSLGRAQSEVFSRGQPTAFCIRGTP